MTEAYEARRKRYPKPGTKAAKRLAKRVAAVFENGHAPPGWVEIQRDDDAAQHGLFGLPVHDDDATELVCRAAGVPRCAGAIVQSAEDPDDDADVYVEPLGTPPRCSSAPASYTRIHAVPAVVALLAGLITEDQLREAMEDWT